MKTPTRVLTTAEMFFKKPVAVQVPYSLLPAALPPPAVAPVPVPPPIDMSAEQFQAPSFTSKVGQLAKKNWIAITAGLVVAGIIIYGKCKKKQPVVKPPLIKEAVKPAQIVEKTNHGAIHAAPQNFMPSSFQMGVAPASAVELPNGYAFDI